MSSKKYYWLKLKDSFFEEDDIKILKRKPNGEKYIVFLLQLRLKAINTNGQLLYKNMFPYDDEMLATITDTDIDVVRTAMKILISLGLVSILENGAINMEQMKDLIGTETKWAEKKRLYRKKEDNVLDMSSPCPPDVRQEIDKDKEIDIDKEQQHKIPEEDHSVNTQNEKNIVVVADNLKNIAAVFTRLTGKHVSNADLQCMKQVVENKVFANIDFDTKERIILQTIEKSALAFKNSNPSGKINSFNYFTKALVNELSKQLTIKKGGKKDEQSSSVIIDEWGHKIDFSKISFK
jgi:predicted phage replisome organizer